MRDCAHRSRRPITDRGHRPRQRKHTSRSEERGMNLRVLSMVSALALATVAPAAAQSTNVTVYLCVGPNGRVRLVTPDEGCRDSERRLSWNLAGLVGPKGDPGPAGPAGPAGPKG